MKGGFEVALFVIHLSLAGGSAEGGDGDTAFAGVVFAATLAGAGFAMPTPAFQSI
jgi:hypothetical protein